MPPSPRVCFRARTGSQAACGGTAIPAPSEGRRLIAEDVQDYLEETLRSKWGSAATGHYAVVQNPYVYFAPGIEQRLRNDRSLWQEVLDRLDDIPGMARVLPVGELSLTSSDPLIRAAALSYVPGRSGDVVLIPDANWILMGRNAPFATTHGTFNQYDRHVPLFSWGPGFGRSVFRRAPRRPTSLRPSQAWWV